MEDNIYLDVDRQLPEMDDAARNSSTLNLQSDDVQTAMPSLYRHNNRTLPHAQLWNYNAVICTTRRRKMRPQQISVDSNRRLSVGSSPHQSEHCLDATLLKASAVR